MDPDQGRLPNIFFQSRRELLLCSWAPLSIHRGFSRNSRGGECDSTGTHSDTAFKGIHVDTTKSISNNIAYQINMQLQHMDMFTCYVLFVSPRYSRQVS